MAHTSRMVVGLALLALVSVFWLSAAPLTARSRGSEVKDIPVDRVTTLIRLTRRQPTVIMLYRSTCPACQTIVPHFVGFVEAQQKARAKVGFLAFATDKDPRTIAHFVSSYRFPFDVWRLEPWQPGELTKAFRRAGVDFPKEFGVPYFIVLDRNRKVVEQWSGESTELAGLRHALSEAQAR